MRQVPLWKPGIVLFTVLISLLYVFPSIYRGTPTWWPSWLPNRIISQGLDLQGGLYLLLSVETDKAVEQTAENLVDEVRVSLRKEHLHYQSAEREGIDAVVIQLADSGDSPKVRQLLEKDLPTVQMVEEPATKRLRMTIKEKEQKEIRRFAMEQSIQTIRSRVDQFGVTEPTIQKQGEDRILIQLPGLTDPTRAKALIGRTARLEFKMVD